MLLRLLLLFTLLPLAELALLLWISEWTGWGPTLGLVLFTGILGAALARREGWRCHHAIRQRMAEGKIPALEMVDGLLVVLSGCVLVTPGIFTDLLGFSLLIPRLRRAVAVRLIARFQSRFVILSPTTPRRPPDDTIDVTSREADPENH